MANVLIFYGKNKENIVCIIINTDITLQIVRFHIIINISNTCSNEHFILFTTENYLIDQDTTAF